MFCVHCGNEVSDEAVICIHCGCALKPQKLNSGSNQSSVSTLKTVANVFMIISTILMGFYLIPLIWCIPMLCCYSSKIRNGEPISIGFKICILIFVSLIGGILLLCDKEDY